MIDVKTWSAIKDFAVARSLSIQYIEDDDRYHLFAIDGAMRIYYRMDRSPTDTADLDDFEDNFKPTGNAALVEKDSDGSGLIRAKTTKTGWHYEPRSICFRLGTAKSLHNKQSDGTTDIGDAGLKFYGTGGLLTQGGEESDEDFQTRLTSDCVATYLDWEPHYTQDIIGATLFVKDMPETGEARTWTVVAPDIPAIYGGSVPFGNGGFNLAFLAPSGRIEINGRGVKTIPYDSVNHSGKIRIVTRHTAGFNPWVQVQFDHFKG